VRVGAGEMMRAARGDLVDCEHQERRRGNRGRGGDE
jgi:hypothetical protein